jgi:peptidoglycan/LPS O-acetylase OafA/YrhL
MSETAPSRAYYPALDGLRAVAFLLVFGQHYYAMPWGWAGVNVFFVLSGFLITGILFDSRDQPHRARNFYIRRTLRIFPLYFGIALLLLLLWPVMRWQWSAWWLLWPVYLGNALRYVSPQVWTEGSPLQAAANLWLHTPLLPKITFYFGHFWSLCVEEQFYLLWPWIVFRVRSRRALLWICGLAVVLTPLLRVATQASAPAWMLRGNLLYCTLPFQLDALLLGGLIALLWRFLPQETLLRLAKLIAAIAAIITGIYLARTLHPTQLFWREHYHYAGWQFTWGLSFIDIFSAALILCCLQPSALLTRALSVRPLRWLGRISYGAYVFHDIFHDVLARAIATLALRHAFFMQHGDKLLFVAALALTLLLASLSYRYFETPFLRLKQRVGNTE